MNLPAPLAPEQAQSRLNQAVSKWAKTRTYDTELHLRAAFEELQRAVGAAVAATVGDVEQETEPDEPTPIPPIAAPKSPYFTVTPTAPAGWPINTTTAALPQYDVATEARIANLLAVVTYPHPIPSGDVTRKRALTRALQMLSLDDGDMP